MMMNRLAQAIAALMIGATATSLAACSSDDRSGESEHSEVAVDVKSAPANTVWVEGPAGLSYPVSDTAGPHENGPVPSGFEASPQGAVVAAITTQVFLSGADDELWPEVPKTLVEPGEGRNQWSQARALMSVSDERIENPPKFRGFKVNDYSDNAAVVSLAAEYTNGMIATLPVQLSRNSGDWRVVLPNQEQAPDLTEITEEDLAAEFTLFGPEEA
ncbi:hypothetical protein KBX18_11640 [Corynebacterium sp. CCUG 69979]|uniref:hypothetical protein n=1 Tax=Corynebacterium sp. CCUG 69979 TaxID=2823890 RepID=UPI00210BE4AB|nr:hypothetical protein [Corynebacterium sp. CCUG 69979]MCQ4626188.1 hypothetical protein [Corynebacterium sp. CCUG 69979]